VVFSPKTGPFKMLGNGIFEQGGEI